MNATFHKQTSELNDKSIVLLIIQHLSNAPRAQKEAAALAQAGAQVTVLGSWWNDQKADEDLKIAKKIGVQYHPLLDLRKKSKLNFFPRLLGKISRLAFSKFGVVSAESFGLTARAMLKKVRRIQPDLTMIHCEPGLWAGKKLAQEGFTVGIDFEDWFSEDLLPEARKERPVATIAKIEKFLLKQSVVSFATTEAMASALQKWSGCERKPIAIPNSFPSDKVPKNVKNLDNRDPQCVSFYWFSQTIGPGRGLETLACVLDQLAGKWQIFLRGNLENYQTWFEDTFSPKSRMRIHIVPLVSNEDLPAYSQSHDVGLALERYAPPSRDLTATNKIFEYLRCGLCIIATDTSGQKEVVISAPNSSFLIASDSEEPLRQALQECIDDPVKLESRKKAAREASQNAWEWSKFKSKIVQEVTSALNS